MLELVTLEEARNQVMVDADSDGSPHDPWLRLYIAAISQAVALWLKDSWRLYEPELDSSGAVVTDSDGIPYPELDSDGLPVVRPVVRAAVLVEIASQFRFREGEGKDNAVTPDAGHGYVLNKASTALLAPLRKPTLA